MDDDECVLDHWEYNGQIGGRLYDGGSNSYVRMMAVRAALAEAGYLSAAVGWGGSASISIMVGLIKEDPPMAVASKALRLTRYLN